MRFRVGGPLRLEKKNILWNFRLRASRDPRRRRIRYDSRFVVPGSHDILTLNRKSTILPRQSQINHEKNSQRIIVPTQV